MKTVKIISGILLTIAYISLTVVGFMNGLQNGLKAMGSASLFVAFLYCLFFSFQKPMKHLEIENKKRYETENRN